MREPGDKESKQSHRRCWEAPPFRLDDAIDGREVGSTASLADGLAEPQRSKAANASAGQAWPSREKRHLQKTRAATFVDCAKEFSLTSNGPRKHARVAGYPAPDCATPWPRQIRTQQLRPA